MIKSRWTMRACAVCGALRQPETLGGFCRVLGGFCRVCGSGAPPTEAFEVVRVSTTPIDLEGPGQARARDGATAKAAAAITVKRGTQRHKVLAHVTNAGDYGATASELVATTGIPYASLTPRVGELKRGGYVEALGRTRNSPSGVAQEVLTVTTLGRRGLRRARR